jgi:hypothetical protein
VIFQVAIISYAAITCLQAVVSRSRRRTGRGYLLVVLATHLPLVVVALQPGITNTVANAVGIGRGADFVVYCAALLVSRCLLSIYQWNTRLESQITSLVRHIALTAPETPGERHAPGGASRG